MAIEKRTRRALQDAMDNILREITGSEPETVDDAIMRVRPYFQRDQALYDALGRAIQNGTDLGVSVAVVQFENIRFGFDWTLANTSARQWAEQYTGELIHEIERTTLDGVRQSVSRWISNSEPLDMLIDDLTPLFGNQRAELIASTEITRAFYRGNLEAWQQSGVVDLIEWRTARDERVCKICGPLHGQRTALGQPFKHPNSGNEYHAPAHPRCRCFAVATLS